MNGLQNFTDDHVSVFQIDGQAVRGRAIHLGAALDQALGKNPDGSDRYPPLVARLLGEAMMIAGLVARALKFDGRLLVQCIGSNDGAISLLVADCTTAGELRGYARYDETQLKQIKLDHRNPGAKTLFGTGTFSMTIDQGPDMDQYQGISAIEGHDLSECAEFYFAQSEQIPTRIKLSCGQVHQGYDEEIWRGGGVMIQKIAGDDLRGDPEESWITAQALFETIGDDELIDPNISQNTLLYRLFHEDGVRVIGNASITAQCSCSKARLENTLRSFAREQLADMADNNIVEANCEFCGAVYKFDITDFT